MVFSTGTKKTLYYKLRNVASGNTLPPVVNFSKTNQNELLDTYVNYPSIFIKVFRRHLNIYEKQNNYSGIQNNRLNFKFKNNFLNDTISNLYYLKYVYFR